MRLEYVPEIGCSVGGCISALKKSWKAYRMAGGSGEPRSDLAYRIVSIQSALGIQKSQFSELPETIYEEESNQGLISEEEIQARREEELESNGEWNLDHGANEELSALDRQLLAEERSEEDDW